MRRAIFLDRDGTVIIDPPDERVDSVNEIELFPDTIEAFAQLANLDYDLFFITNQAGIAEGRYALEDVKKIDDKILSMIAPTGAMIKKVYVCPHAPDQNCSC